MEGTSSSHTACTWPCLPATATKKNVEEEKEADHDVVRPLADFHPSVWGEIFIHLMPPPDQKYREWMQQRVEKLKEEVKTMLANVCGHLGEEMDLVDTIQRLGLTYHFEEEIRQALVNINDTRVNSEDLHVISLRFRLLRQDGYYISPDEFNKFKEVDGHFRRNLGFDVKGLLSLYEAAYLGTQADIILEEAITFCRSKLEPMLDHLQHPILLEVARALETPMIRRMKRLEARQYISFYEASQRCNDSMLELAKINFNLLQLLHQEEIRNLSMWWKELE